MRDSREERIRIALGQHYGTMPPQEANEWFRRAFAGEAYEMGTFNRLVRQALVEPSSLAPEVQLGLGHLGETASKNIARVVQDPLVRPGMEM